MKLLYYFTAFICVGAEIVRYDNYKVYRLTPKSDLDVQFLRQLQTSGLKFDFWKSSALKNVSSDVMVSPQMETKFKDIIKNVQIDCELMIDNVQRLIDETKPRYNIEHEFGWTEYYRLEQIYGWLTNLKKKYPNNVEIIIGGKSYEGRDIKGVKLSFKKGNKGVFLEGGIHAREWITPAVITHILNELLTSENPDVREIAEYYDWYIFPVINPDGYEYSHTTDRLWRMTRQPHGSCIGADPNRNWEYHWNEGGNTSNNTCDETYAGPFPFSEIETKTLSEYITKINNKLVGYLSIHSYSQLLLIPYGYTGEHLDNFAELLEIGKKAVRSLEKRYGTKFKVGNMAEAIYVATGVSTDWVKGTFQIPITYTYELRDAGKYGFILPSEQIIPSAEELLDSIVTIMKEAKKRGY